MNSTTKKVLPALLLATAFNTTSVIAADTKHHATQNVKQCLIGENITTSKQVNTKLQKINDVDATDSMKSNNDTQTLLSSIDAKISAELDASMSKINSKIDQNLSKVTSSISAYFIGILSN